MKIAAQQGEDRASSASVRAKKPDGTLTVPYIAPEGVEGIALGFRAEMFTLSDETGKEMGRVLSGGGFGSDWIILQWGKKEIALTGLELLRAWLTQIDPAAAKQLPKGHDE